MRHTTSPLHSDRDTTHNWKLKERQCASCAQPRNCAKDHAPQEQRGTLNQRQPRDKTNRQILHSAWFSKHTTRLRIHTCACLKHSNFLNPDRMRKPGLSNCCSHETLLHFGLQQLRQGRIKQLPNSSNLKTWIRAPKRCRTSLSLRID